MERCVACGKGVRSPVWAEYADAAFVGKVQAPFPLHGGCFDAAEYIDAARWVPDPDAEDRAPMLETSRERRYRRVNAPAAVEA